MARIGQNRRCIHLIGNNMQDIFIHIKIFTQSKFHHVWIRDTYVIEDFIQDIEKSWPLERTTFAHFFYHTESGRILNSGKTFRENAVISGDHFILF